MRNATLLALALVIGFCALTFTGCQGKTKAQDDQEKTSLVDKAKGFFGGGKTEEPTETEEVEESSNEAQAAVPNETTDTPTDEPEATETTDDSTVTVKTSWLWSFLLFPNIGFWIACVAAFILISLYAEYEDYDEYQGLKQGGNVAAGLLVAGLIYLNRGIFVELWESYHWVGLATVIGIFVISGITNFWIKWELKTSGALDKIKEREQEFLANDAHGKDANGRVYSEIPDDKAVIQARNEYFHSKDWTLELPKKAQNKALLTKWACTGPISLPGTVLINGAQVFGNTVYNWFGFLADRITKRHEGQIKR